MSGHSAASPVHVCCGGDSPAPANGEGLFVLPPVPFAASAVVQDQPVPPLPKSPARVESCRHCEISDKISFESFESMMEAQDKASSLEADVAKLGEQVREGLEDAKRLRDQLRAATLRADKAEAALNKRALVRAKRVRGKRARPAGCEPSSRPAKRACITLSLPACEDLLQIAIGTSIINNIVNVGVSIFGS